MPSTSVYTAEEHKHFAGWSIYPNGEIRYSDEQAISNLTTVETTIHLYAQWEYDRYEIVYTLSRIAIHTDIVSYGSPYTFKTAFDGYENYEVIRITNLYYICTVAQWNNSALKYGVNYEKVYFYNTSNTMQPGYKYWKYEKGGIVTFNG